MARKAFVTCDSCERALTVSTHPDDSDANEQLRKAKWFVIDTPAETLELCGPPCVLAWAQSHQPAKRRRTGQAP